MSNPVKLSNRTLTLAVGAAVLAATLFWTTREPKYTPEYTYEDSGVYYAYFGEDDILSSPGEPQAKAFVLRFEYMYHEVVGYAVRYEDCISNEIDIAVQTGDVSGSSTEELIANEILTSSERELRVSIRNSYVNVGFRGSTVITPELPYEITELIHSSVLNIGCT